MCVMEGDGDELALIDGDKGVEASWIVFKGMSVDMVMSSDEEW